MHLKQLKLAGFKSFIEPTVISFPSQLVGVVGPNGCGKSNIIDAVRWVMGESSAKNLRGGSMTDVIFNGSAHRKPLGQASVELVFDNTSGRLTGQYATYQEIAIKRVVTRDGESSYYLNGSRCRRRDIHDVFLGTGAGARGYAIIGQDMITRLIEARPEDLRVYFEEAGGVSKYKERRRETQQRIQNTRENLERVQDICNELNKQLSRLERQAKTAERFKQLKAEERVLKTEILALKWQALDQEQKTIRQELHQLSLQYEEQQAKITSMQKDEFLLRESHQAGLDTLQQTQTQFYTLGNEIARLEESLHQQQREMQRFELDIKQTQEEQQTVANQLQQDKKNLQDSEQSERDLQQALNIAEEEYSALEKRLQEKQQLEHVWNQHWQESVAAKDKAGHEAKLAQLKLQHIEERKQQALVRLDRIRSEQETIQKDSIEAELRKKEIERESITQQYEQAVIEHQQAQNLGDALREKLTKTEQQLHHVQDTVHLLATEHAAALAAQEMALKSETASNLPGWEAYPRLLDEIKVREPWVQACEMVLGESLRAVLLDSLDSLWTFFSNWEKTSAIWITRAEKEEKQTSVYPRLIDKIEGSIPHWLYGLKDIFAAEDLTQALSWLPTLHKGQSVVTLDGYWLGQGWVQFKDFNKNKTGLITKKQTAEKLNDVLCAEQKKLQHLQTERHQQHVELTENTKQCEQLKAVVITQRELLKDCDAEISRKKQTLTQISSRLDILSEEIAELQEALETLADERVHTESQSYSAMKEEKEWQQQQQKLMAEKSLWENEVISLKHQEKTLKSSVQQRQLHWEREKLFIQQLKDGIQRETQRLQVLNEKVNTFTFRRKELDEPHQQCKVSLEEKITQHQRLSEQMSEMQRSAEELQAHLNNLKQEYRATEHETKLLQEKIQQQQMQQQALQIRANSLLESLEELSVNLQDTLINLTATISLSEREQELLRINDKIKQIGAVNLVAIEEYQTELQRKQYLDEQQHDLSEALTTLELAVAKMDKETQSRLQDTFDHINTSFQSLFPLLFGGGRAILEWTCDNLLEAGIVVMAQPPGKRNSTINMLSGGEKAMTAVALVFAIFQLNPAPFCMLDEVDAPLDDANVRRFSDLVKEMSPFVQFLFITHNKVTMELADHLIGVTMREPGVSRVVAVDVEQALSIVK